MHSKSSAPIWLAKGSEAVEGTNAFLFHHGLGTPSPHFVPIFSFAQDLAEPRNPSIGPHEALICSRYRVCGFTRCRFVQSVETSGVFMHSRTQSVLCLGHCTEKLKLRPENLAA